MQKHGETLLVKDANGEYKYKSYYDALESMSKVWNKMIQDDKDEVAKIVGGEKRKGKFSVVLDEYSKSEN